MSFTLIITVSKKVIVSGTSIDVNRISAYIDQTRRYIIRFKKIIINKKIYITRIK